MSVPVSLINACGIGTANEFRSRIRDPAFPCVGAKAALAQGRVHFLEGGDLREPRSDRSVVGDMQDFARKASSRDVFVSMVVLYESTPAIDECGFENALWARLRAFHAIDKAHHGWDPSVSSDPHSRHFSYSLGGRAFYVVGLHPHASRPSRRFRCAALVFNLHSQFEMLRADGRYDRLRETIIARDVAFSGSANPMLARHGVESETRQYSGREVGTDWRCPFMVNEGRRIDAS